jgi:DNA-binding CsgD family transcriptional regulator
MMNPVAEAGEMVGRAAEMASMIEWLRSASSGQGRAVVVEGEAGIGKSRLIQEALVVAGEAGFAAAVGVADEFDRRRPFGVMADALAVDLSAMDARRADIARSLLDHRSQPAELSPAAEYRLVEAMVGLIETLWTETPTVLVVENLHWADPSTLACLRRLGRLVSQHAGLVIVTTRPGEDMTHVLNPRGDATLEHVVLGPIDGVSVAALAEQLLSVAPGPHLLSQLEGARGNPLFVLELIAALDREGAIVRHPDGADIGAASRVVSLPLTILHGLSALPAGTLEVLSLASVLGSSFEVIDLPLLCGRPVVELVGPLRVALRAGVLIEDGNRLSFRHDLVHAALYDDLPLSVRTGLHREMARALANGGASAYRVAEHLLRAGGPGDHEVVEWLRQAGWEVGTQAPSVAVELFERAAELAGPSLGAAHADLAIALMWSGRNREGEALAKRVLAGPADAPEAALLLQCLLGSLLMRGRLADALFLARQFEQSDTSDRRLRLELRAIIAAASVFVGDYREAHSLASAAAEEARQMGDQVAECHAEVALALVESKAGRFSNASQHGAAAAAIAEGPLASAVVVAQPHGAYAMTLLELDRIDDAREALARGRPLLEQYGGRANVATSDFLLAIIEFCSGRWDDAMAAIEAGLDIAEQTVSAWRVDMMPVRSLIALHRGELDLAEAALSEAEAAFATGEPCYRPTWLPWVRSQLLEATGSTERALDTLRNGWQLARTIGFPHEYSILGPDLARRAVAAGDFESAQDVVHAVSGVAGDNPKVARFQVATLWCTGLLDRRTDDLLEAAELARSMPRPLQRGQLCEDSAAALATDGRVEEAKSLLRDALVSYETLQASARVDSATARLRALGVRVGGGRRPPRPVSGWDALTDTERKVAGLIAHHLSNPEIAERLFLSRRTVETHVSHALAKLGCPTRRELAAEAIKQGVSQA